MYHVCNLTKKEYLSQTLPYEFFENSFFTEHFWVTNSVFATPCDIGIKYLMKITLCDTNMVILLTTVIVSGT